MIVCSALSQPGDRKQICSRYLNGLISTNDIGRRKTKKHCVMMHNIACAIAREAFQRPLTVLIIHKESYVMILHCNMPLIMEFRTLQHDMIGETCSFSCEDHSDWRFGTWVLCRSDLFYATQLDLNDLNFFGTQILHYIHWFPYSAWNVSEAVAKSAVESKAWWCQLNLLIR